MTFHTCPSAPSFFFNALNTPTSWHWLCPSWPLGEILVKTLVSTAAMWGEYHPYLFEKVFFHEIILDICTVLYSLQSDLTHIFSCLTTSLCLISLSRLWGEGMGLDRELFLTLCQEGKYRNSRAGKTAQFKARKMGKLSCIPPEKMENLGLGSGGRKGSILNRWVRSELNKESITVMAFCETILSLLCQRGLKTCLKHHLNAYLYPVNFVSWSSPPMKARSFSALRRAGNIWNKEVTLFSFKSQSNFLFSCPLGQNSLQSQVL